MKSRERNTKMHPLRRRGDGHRRRRRAHITSLSRMRRWCIGLYCKTGVWRGDTVVYSPKKMISFSSEKITEEMCALRGRRHRRRD